MRLFEPLSMAVAVHESIAFSAVAVEVQEHVNFSHSADSGHEALDGEDGWVFVRGGVLPLPV